MKKTIKMLLSKKPKKIIVLVRDGPVMWPVPIKKIVDNSDELIIELDIPPLGIAKSH